jgi:hypothetical protein
LVRRAEAATQTIADLVETAWHRSHAHAFEHLEVGSMFRAMPDRWEPALTENLRSSAERVCTDLILTLEAKQLTKEKEVSAVKWRRGAIEYQGKTHSFRQRSTSFRICENMFASCRKPGDSMEAAHLFVALFDGPYVADPLGNWKRLCEAVDNVNKWANRHGLPRLFRCTRQAVIRLA